MEKPADLILSERLSRQLDWNLLRTYIAIVQAGGISRAATQLGLTQPAVSQALKRLEEHIGSRLIERNARVFEVTEPGKIVYAKAQEIHNHVSGLGRIRDEGNQVAGRVRLLFASRLKSGHLDRLLQSFHGAYPRINFQIDVLPSVEIRALIRQGSATAGFCLLRGKPKGLSSTLFFRQQFGLFCGASHALYGQTDLTEDDLRDADFITYPSDQIGGVLSPLAIYREQHVYQGQLIGTSTSLDEIIRMTEIGFGVGIVPIHVAQDYIADGRLWQLPPYKGIGPIDIHLLWNPATEITEAERTFLKHARLQMDGRQKTQGHPP